MVEKKVFGRAGPRVTFKCYEGTCTITETHGVGGNKLEPVFSAPIADKDLVNFYAEGVVRKLPTSATEIIGRVIGTPQWKGKQPTSTKTWGNYEPRIVTVECMCTFIDMVTLEPLNTAVALGHSVTPGATTAGTFDKDATANDTYALEAADSSSGDDIAVMFGFTGRF